MLAVEDLVHEQPDILLVEDNDDDAELVQAIYRKHNVNATMLRLRNGREALDHLLPTSSAAHAMGATPKIVLMDINLPKVDGISVLKRLRAQHRTERMPVVVFTSSASDYKAFEAYRLGITSYIRKGSSFAQFEEAILEMNLFLREYKVLIVDDNRDDAEMICHELKTSTLKCICTMASNKKEYIAALETFKPDIVFCDFDLQPRFDAIQAVRILRQSNLRIPFVLVTGKLDEDLASACLSEGMDDYLLKGSPKRFPVALINALRKWQSERALKEKEQQLSLIYNATGDAMWLMEVEGKGRYRIISVNRAYTKYKGLAPDQVIGKFMEDVLPAASQDAARRHFEQVLSTGKALSFTHSVDMPAGSRTAQMTLTPIYDEGHRTLILGTAIDLTERKNAEEILRRSNEQFRLLAENTSDLVALHDPEGAYIYVSPSSKRILGYEPPELIGLSPYTIMHSDDQERVRLGIHAQSRSGEPHQKAEYRLRHKNGEYIWLESIAVPIFDTAGREVVTIQSTSRDISDRKRAEEEIANRSEHLQRIMDVSVDVICTANAGGEFVSISASCEKLWGYKPAELVGKPFLDYVFEEDVPKTLQVAEEIVAGKFVTNFENRYKHRTGTLIPMAWSSRWDERSQLMYAVARDVTESKQSEAALKSYSADLEEQVKSRTHTLEDAVRELEKTKEELHKALQEEKTLNELKSRFVSMASHEFRTPLTSILSFAALARRYAELGDQEQGIRQAGKIKNLVHHLTTLLDDFLSLSKLEEGKLSVNPETFDIQAFIGSAIEEMGGLRRPGQVLTYRHTGSVNAHLDPKLFRHILLNLLSNAIKYSADDGTIEVLSDVRKSSIKVSVKDNGIGIPKKDERHMFERFFRASNVAHIQGTGLGLSIVRRYVDLMRGTLTFKSEENQGTEFYLNFQQ